MYVKDTYFDVIGLSPNYNSLSFSLSACDQRTQGQLEATKFYRVTHGTREHVSFQKFQKFLERGGFNQCLQKRR